MQRAACDFSSKKLSTIFPNGIRQRFVSSGSFVLIFQMSVFLSVFFFLCMVTIVCRSYSSGLSRVSSLFYGKGELSWFFRIKKRLINATDRSFEKHEMLDCRCYWQHSHEVGRNANHIYIKRAASNMLIVPLKTDLFTGHRYSYSSQHIKNLG